MRGYDFNHFNLDGQLVLFGMVGYSPFIEHFRLLLEGGEPIRLPFVRKNDWFHCKVS